MKIYLLPVQKILQPETQSFAYPAHNKNYGVEQDFLVWLHKNPQLLTDDINKADWHYLPVFWTRYFLNNNFGKNNEAILDLQEIIDQTLVKSEITFTICQYDDGPVVNLGNTLQFLASRRDKIGIDIPLLCNSHKVPFLTPSKKYIACFNGNFATHPIREEMRIRFSSNPNYKIGNPEPQRIWNRILKGPKFIDNIRSSYISLTPRGYGGSSFRFFESMQLGTAPCLVNDFDVRPFKQFIDWDSSSYYASSVDELDNLLSSLDKNEALKKGKEASLLFKNELSYQKWCKYVIRELGVIK